MAKAINYDVPLRPQPNAAREELDQLLQNLHDQGILRLVNDFLRASPQVMEILLRGLNLEQSRSAMQNLALLGMALGRIPPERFAVMTEALSEALQRMEQAAGASRQDAAPGLIGTYKLLHDDQLWRGLKPVIEALKGFSSGLSEPPEKPAARRHDGAGRS